MKYLRVQRYLKENSLDDLKESLGIKHRLHENLPLVILNYDQIKSPKIHRIVRECRGLVLDTRDYSVVARAFPRFFNLGEVPSDDGRFNWSDFTCIEKVDGSIMLLYYFEGRWMVNTRGSFGDAETESGYKFENIFWKYISAYDLKFLDPKLTYVFELVGPLNKVVREYEEGLYLLGMFCKNGDSIPTLAANHVSDWLNVKRPKHYNCKSIDEVHNLLKDFEKNDPTFEGFVLRDNKDMRIKVKSASYVELHRIKGNGAAGSIPNFCRLYAIGELDEITTLFPEYKESFNLRRVMLDKHLREAQTYFDAANQIQDQKEFALGIQNHPAKSLMFMARKKGCGLFEREILENYTKYLEKVVVDAESY